MDIVPKRYRYEAMKSIMKLSKVLKWNSEMKSKEDYREWVCTLKDEFYDNSNVVIEEWNFPFSGNEDLIDEVYNKCYETREYRKYMVERSIVKYMLRNRVVESYEKLKNGSISLMQDIFHFYWKPSNLFFKNVVDDLINREYMCISNEKYEYLA
jgi:hypothetical protein